MKKTIKYSTVIVAALLAIAPFVGNQTAKADNTKQIIKSGTTEIENKDQQSEEDEETGETTGKVAPTERPKDIVPDQTKNIKNAQTVKVIFDKELLKNPQHYDEEDYKAYSDPRYIYNLKFKYQKGMTVQDVYNYIENHAQLVIGNKRPKKLSEVPSLEIYAENDEELDEKTSLEPGQTLHRIDFGLNSGYHFTPNTWYQWTQMRDGLPSKYIFDDFGDNVENYNKNKKELAPVVARLSEKSLGNNMTLVSMKTDENGTLPDFDGVIQPYNTNYNDPYSMFTVTISNDADAIKIPVNSSTSKDNSKSTEPDHNADSKPISKSDADFYNNIDSTVPEIDITNDPNTDKEQLSKKSTNKSTTVVKTNKSNTKTTAVRKNANNKYTLRYSSLVYNRKGKLVKNIFGSYIMLRQYRQIRLLDNAKVTKIKGQKFYRIGKNRYIRVANAVLTSKVKKYSFRHGKRHYVVLDLYNNKGRLHIVFKPKNKKEKAKSQKQKERENAVGMEQVLVSGSKRIKGKLYYKILGSRFYVRADQVKKYGKLVK